jgi:hypothetical protein
LWQHIQAMIFQPQKKTSGIFRKCCGASSREVERFFKYLSLCSPRSFAANHLPSELNPKTEVGITLETLMTTEKTEVTEFFEETNDRLQKMPDKDPLCSPLPIRVWMEEQLVWGRRNETAGVPHGGMRMISRLSGSAVLVLTGEPTFGTPSQT